LVGKNVEDHPYPDVLADVDAVLTCSCTREIPFPAVQPSQQSFDLLRLSHQTACFRPLKMKFNNLKKSILTCWKTKQNNQDGLKSEN